MSGITAILPAFNKKVSIGSIALEKMLYDMEFGRPLYYFTVPGTLMATLGVGLGLELLRIFYHSGSLYFGPMVLMVLLMLVGSCMALTGVILHTLSRLASEIRGDYNRSTGHWSSR